MELWEERNMSLQYDKHYILSSSYTGRSIKENIEIPVKINGGVGITSSEPKTVKLDLKIQLGENGASMLQVETRTIFRYTDQDDVEKTKIEEICVKKALELLYKDATKLLEDYGVDNIVLPDFTTELQSA